MRPTTLLLTLALLPLAVAHTDGGIDGTPKDYCEPEDEWNTHEYGAPATGRVIFSPQDGNLGGECNGFTSLNPGTPCFGFDDPSDLGSVYVGLCGQNIDPPLADYDGHTEHAYGGALILACESGCGWDVTGGGASLCFGEEAHHVYFGPVSVVDNVLGSGATFIVTADTVNLVPHVDPSSPDCGDRQADESTECVGSCTVTFLPGLDGMYRVFVEGTAGHVLW